MIVIDLVCTPDRTEAERAMMRAAFESYSDGKRNAAIKAAISTAASTYTAVAASGPVGLLVIPLALLSGFWSQKAYREEAYAYFDAMGWVSPRPPRRGVWDSAQRDDGRSRRSFGRGCPGEVAFALYNILSENDPDLTEAQLDRIAQDSKTTFAALETAFPDIPKEVTAEVVMAAHGIYRKQGDDGYVYEPPSGDGFTLEPPEPPQDEELPLPEDDEDKPKDAYTDWLYAAAGLAVAFVLTRR